jgi:competence protein ComEA
MSVIRLILTSLVTLCLTAVPVAYADSTDPSTTAPAVVASDDTASQTTDTVTSSDHTAKKLQTVNINTADASTIASSLHGIGAKRAEAIVNYRTQNGPFKTVDDLTKIKGISKKIVDQNRDHIALS